MSTTLLDVEAVRRRFSSLQGGFAFFDAPGGSQVPDEVGEAMARTLRDASGNLGAPYETGRRVEAILHGARDAAGRFLGCASDEVVFGANMTTLNFTLTRTASRDWREGDRILATRLDHDGNVAPWLELAADKGLHVDLVDVTPEGRLDLADVERKLTDRTRVVSFPAASNAIGTITEIREVCALARDAGALSWIDAVHYAAHEPIDVAQFGCDVLLCSPYKFCGPHLGLAFGRAEVLESWRPYKARPAPGTPLGRRFETGTAPFELLAGFGATIAYLDSLGGLEPIRDYERELGRRFVDGLPEGVLLYGPQTMEGRVPTFLLNVEGVPAATVATTLAERGYGVWAHNNWYSLGLYQGLGYEKDAIRAGIIHYNTAEEVDGLLAEFASLAP
ncbi:MAG TPA: cysteine desulfurase-like protein [Gaiellaceae bacterium]